MLKEKDNLKKENILSRLWKRSVFPDVIQAKKEENELKREIAREAKKEALKELKPQLVKIYKEKELARMTGKDKDEKSKRSWGEKLKEGFDMKGVNIGNDEQMAKMLGEGKSDPGDKIGMMLGSDGESGDDKIARMLGKPPEVDIEKGLGENDDESKRKKDSGKKKSGKKKNKSKETTPTSDKTDIEKKIESMLG